MNNFNRVTVTDGTRTELHDLLNLTGAEISVNTLPAGISVFILIKRMKRFTQLLKVKERQ